MKFIAAAKMAVFSASTATLLATTPAFAEMSAGELAKLAQNPVGNLISVPFQNNTNLNFGPGKKDPERAQYPAGDSGFGQ